MGKKYLKNIEDIEALRNTDTKIYRDKGTGYHKFVNGVLCFFTCEGEDKLFTYNTTLGDLEDHYIEVEDEPSEDLIGKLGWVSDVNDNIKTRCAVLVEYSPKYRFPYVVGEGSCWKYFTPLTRKEVEKYTGYKVVKEV